MDPQERRLIGRIRKNASQPKIINANDPESYGDYIGVGELEKVVSLLSGDDKGFPLHFIMDLIDARRYKDHLNTCFYEAEFRPKTALRTKLSMVNLLVKACLIELIKIWKLK